MGELADTFRMLTEDLTRIRYLECMDVQYQSVICGNMM